MSDKTRVGPRRRAHVRVTGIVQGVGFRPHVHRMATELGLGGVVGNDSGGVFIEVEGLPETLEVFVERLRTQPPPLAVIESLTVTPASSRGQRAFAIVPSGREGANHTLISPDIATCQDCLAELRDPTDRRHGYAFINCTNCGPRYTIVRDVPYDRPSTTMAAFELCGKCAAEYHDPGDRRFHAQPTCCAACGPRLRVLDGDGRALPGDPVAAAGATLRSGQVVAVKGLGGYHLAVDATSESAAATLRTRKRREDKPFAVMVADLADARRFCEVGAEEAALLEGPARPIVLLPRRDDVHLAGGIAPGRRELGLMLPYTPLHYLLIADLDGPIVLTSGNGSDEPIIYRDDLARDRLGKIADVFLSHDRGIHVPVDDSVTRVVAGRTNLLRRSRGYAPRPVGLTHAVPRHVLGVGAELKNTVCLARDSHAFVSHHLGDLKNYETFRAFTHAIEHLSRIFDVRPAVIAHDLHPEYLSTGHAFDLAALASHTRNGEMGDDVELVGVQHHHAHIASCMADNGVGGPVIGLALDGTGLGTDGTVWGGEVLVADLADAERVGHLEVVAMPGGEAAIREPWRMAAAHLDAAFEGRPPDGLAVMERNAGRWRDVLAVAHGGVNSPPTSSAGRLFDAVSSILSIRDVITYEGQAAIELEQLADRRERDLYPVSIIDGEPFELAAGQLVRAVVTDLVAGSPRGVVAARFHNSVAAQLTAACDRVRDSRGLSTVALSGGVFQNVVLLERTVARLEDVGYRVLTHDRVPTNDGGVSLGQAVVAAARDRRR